MVKGGGHENFLWDTQSWAFFDSENSGGSGAKNSGGKPLDLGSNTQTPRGKEVAMSLEGKKRGWVDGKNDQVEGEGKNGDQTTSDHEMHIWTERERRKKMRDMFSGLHALLPDLPPKADKSTIVDEAIRRITSLQKTFQQLQKKKIERLHGVTFINNSDPSMDCREGFMANQVASMATPSDACTALSGSRFPPMFKTWTSPNVILNVCGEQAQINIYSLKKPRLLSSICCALEKYKIEVVSAHVSSDQNLMMCMIQAHVSMGPNQLAEAFPVEDIYKQAAGEIMLWINS
ncbi:transcription factor bHLH95 [Diospyros lotus]|uniref:transcription factor bHLH95 n=1 Tax=Diospyros lotus TaxID=55363 RepID=UPI00225437D6|nr:transcription factor bHLH95 [Diospyros lotus]